MVNDLAALGLSTVDKGGMYRALRAMEEDGLVASGWEPSHNGPLRRSYDLTPEGRTWLKAGADAMRSGQEFAAAYLRRYEESRQVRRASPHVAGRLSSGRRRHAPPRR